MGLLQPVQALEFPDFPPPSTFGLATAPPGSASSSMSMSDWTSPFTDEGDEVGNAEDEEAATSLVDHRRRRLATGVAKPTSPLWLSAFVLVVLPGADEAPSKNKRSSIAACPLPKQGGPCGKGQ